MPNRAEGGHFPVDLSGLQEGLAMVKRMQAMRSEIARARFGLSYSPLDLTARGSAARQIVASVLRAKRAYLKRWGDLTMYGTIENEAMGAESAIVYIDGTPYYLDTDSQCSDCGFYYQESRIRRVDGADYCPACLAERFTECTECGEFIPRDDAISVDGEDYCESCHDERFATCANCRKTVARDDDAHFVDRRRGGGWYCGDCFNEHFATCCACDEVIPQEESHTVNGDTYCDNCYCEHYTSCESCGEEIACDDAFYSDNGVYCTDCAPDGENDGAQWDMGAFSPSRVFREMKSHRRYGVELETSSCPDHGSLEGRTLFGCKDDGSIKGMEFVSPALSSDKGLGEIREFCRLAERNGFKVDKNCGYHAHFDISREPAANIKAILVAYHATYALWASMVPPDRRRNHHCKCHDWQPSEFDDVLTQADFRSKVGCIDRYQWCNVSAYYRHGTVEIRLHSATLDAEKICNWVKAHARFIDWAVKHTPWEIRNRFQGSPSEQFQALAEIWDDTGLADFYRRRAEKFGTCYRALQVA
jgi:formylmethanofuran dehydrogenase subunit E